MLGKFAELTKSILRRLASIFGYTQKTNSREDIPQKKAESIKAQGKFDALKQRHLHLNSVHQEVKTKYKNLYRRFGFLKQDIFFQQTAMAVGKKNSLMAYLTDNKINNQFDLVISRELGSGYAGLHLASQSRSGRMILDVVEHPFLSGRSGQADRERQPSNDIGSDLFANVFVDVLNRADGAIATSQSQIDILTQLGCNHDIRLVRNCRMSTDGAARGGGAFEATSSVAGVRHGLGPDDKVLLYANNVYPSGGAIQCIEALARLPEDYHLVFLGRIMSGEDAITQAIEVSGVTERVAFLDLVDPSELVEHCSSADIALLPLLPDVPNNRTALPNRVFDSIASGNPYLAARGTEMGDFALEHGVGDVFEHMEPQHMADKIEQTVARTRAGEFDQAMTQAQATFTWENELEKLTPLVKPADSPSRTPIRAAILALKTIRTNDRVRRLSLALLAQGYAVEVFAYDQPAESLRLPQVEYHVVTA